MNGFLHRLRTLASLLQYRSGDVVGGTVLVFLRLALVPVLYRSVVAGDTAVDLSALSADRADAVFADQIAMLCTDGIRR